MNSNFKHLSLAISFIVCLISCSSNSNEIQVSYDVVAEAVDLGLSVKWASHNLGATSPTEFGGYYSFGETDIKTEYTDETYMFAKNRIVSNISGTSGDAAKVHWGNGWRIPTKIEIDELRSKCKWEYTKIDDVEGFRITGPSGNSIFLPCASDVYGTDIPSPKSAGVLHYTSSTPCESAVCYVYACDEYDTTGHWMETCGVTGTPIRPVQ